MKRFSPKIICFSNFPERKHLFVQFAQADNFFSDLGFAAFPKQIPWTTTLWERRRNIWLVNTVSWKCLKDLLVVLFEQFIGILQVSHQFLAWSQHSKTFLTTNFPREGKKSPRVQRKEKQLRVLITVAIILISMDSFQVHCYMGTQVLPRLPTFLWRQFLLSTASCILQIRPERPF